MALTQLLKRADVSDALRELLQAGGTPEQQKQCLLAFADEATTEVVRRELAEFPAHVTTTICQAWATADQFNKRFELVSVAPDSALDFARHGRVRIAVDTEEDRVRVTLSHVPGHHASWLGRKVPVLAS